MICQKVDKFSANYSSGFEMKPTVITAVTTNTSASDVVLWRRRAVIFGLCFCYWIYLFFSSRMVIAMDAISYEKLGELIYRDGWLAYFRTGPNREPLYPFLISISMRIAGEHYPVIQKIMQIFLLFFTQLLAFSILGKLKVREFFQFLVILYIGFSPAIVNSVFSLYYEILALPFVVAMILISTISWQAIRTGRAKQSFFLGFLSGVLFLDSAGLATLLALSKIARTENKDLRLVATGSPRRVLRITGIDRVLTLED